MVTEEGAREGMAKTLGRIMDEILREANETLRAGDLPMAARKACKKIIASNKVSMPSCSYDCLTMKCGSCGFFYTSEDDEEVNLDGDGDASWTDRFFKAPAFACPLDSCGEESVEWTETKASMLPPFFLAADEVRIKILVEHPSPHYILSPLFTGNSTFLRGAIKTSILHMMIPMARIDIH